MKIKGFVEKYLKVIISILTALFLLFGQGVTWYCMGGDTEAYYMEFSHHIETKPLYSLLMEGFRRLLGMDRYLYGVAVVQILLSVVCISYFTEFIRKRLKLGIINTMIIWALSLLPYIILLPEDVISHSLMTESITYPLIYVFVIWVLKGIYDNRIIYVYGSIVLTIILTLVRGQMLFLLAISVVAFIFIQIKYRNKHILVNILIFVVFLLALVKTESILTLAYEAHFFNAPVMDYSAQTLVQKAMFCADREDAILFKDEITKEVFEKTIDISDQKHSNYKYMTNDLYDWKHTTDAFGDISYTLGDVVESVAKEKGIEFKSQYDREQLVIKCSEDIAKVIIYEHPDRFLKVSISMMPSGFVSTVLFHKQSIYGIIHIFTLLFYVVLISGTAVLIFNRKKNEQLIRVGEYALIVICLSVVNVVASDLVHMGLQRYQAYTLGLNWVAMWLLFVQGIEYIQQQHCLHK